MRSFCVYRQFNIREPVFEDWLSFESFPNQKVIGHFDHEFATTTDSSELKKSWVTVSDGNQGGWVKAIDRLFGIPDQISNVHSVGNG